MDPSVQTYMTSAKNLSVLNGCLLHGDRVVIPPLPPALQLQVLKLLHKVHQASGSCPYTKGLARSYFWWPSMSQDVEKFIATCEPCLSNRSKPPSAPILQWPMPERAWSRIHLDFAGPFHGHTFLLLVDAYSKWVEVADTQGSMSTITVLKHCRHWFSMEYQMKLLVTMQLVLNHLKCKIFVKFMVSNKHLVPHSTLLPTDKLNADGADHKKLAQKNRSTYMASGIAQYFKDASCYT
jgi:hypothetical protein